MKGLHRGWVVYASQDNSHSPRIPSHCSASPDAKRYASCGSSMGIYCRTCGCVSTWSTRLPWALPDPLPWDAGRWPGSPKPYTLTLNPKHQHAGRWWKWWRACGGRSGASGRRAGSWHSSSPRCEGRRVARRAPDQAPPRPRLPRSRCRSQACTDGQEGCLASTLQVAHQNHGH